MPRLKKFLSGPLLLVVTIILLLITANWHAFIKQAIIQKNQTVDYVIPYGSTITSVAKDLYERGYLSYPKFFIAFAYLERSTKKIKAGEYRLVGELTPIAFLKQITSGKVLQHKFTIVEGWTIKELLQAINNNSVVVHTPDASDIDQVKKILDIPQTNPEGLFLPDTYFFTRGMTDVMLLKRAYSKMQHALAKQWNNRGYDLNLKSPYEALIVASLVERETNLDAERSKIAGVIQRRLEKRMPLQIDAAVIYGLGTSYKGKLEKKDLKTPSPYNTYLIYGLPPTPISLPSEESIKATLHPEQSNDLYFVATGKGGHFFSDNLEAHNKAVERLIGSTKNEK